LEGGGVKEVHKEDLGQACPQKVKEINSKLKYLPLRMLSNVLRPQPLVSVLYGIRGGYSLFSKH
jgi:hypothetical protein